VEKYCGAGHITDDSKIRLLRIACWITERYKHTLRICNTHCFSIATVVARTRIPCYVIPTLPVVVFFFWWIRTHDFMGKVYMSNKVGRSEGLG